mmetsp:Transcript_31567/g.69110  ORF Transcript_31567/g.69110 Transcript_31567/m.69110 type:complete len:279 (-) Transcript_31567:582-1418(-)
MQLCILDDLLVRLIEVLKFLGDCRPRGQIVASLSLPYGLQLRQGGSLGKLVINVPLTRQAIDQLLRPLEELRVGRLLPSRLSQILQHPEVRVCGLRGLLQGSGQTGLGHQPSPESLGIGDLLGVGTLCRSVVDGFGETFHIALEFVGCGRDAFPLNLLCEQNLTFQLRPSLLALGQGLDIHWLILGQFKRGDNCLQLLEVPRGAQLQLMLRLSDCGLHFIAPSHRLLVLLRLCSVVHEKLRDLLLAVELHRHGAQISHDRGRKLLSCGLARFCVHRLL